MSPNPSKYHDESIDLNDSNKAKIPQYERQIPNTPIQQQKQKQKQNNNNNISSSPSSSVDNNNSSMIGRLKRIKQREAKLSNLLRTVRQEKLTTLRSFPLRIGVIGFGRFGQFIAKSFRKYSNHVVVTSRSDYTDLAERMDMKYVPLEDPKAFLDENLDVIVLATSILSFEETVKQLSPYLKEKLASDSGGGGGGGGEEEEEISGPLIVDVLSVKEHPRNILLEYLPKQCDILCTHPMFGPDSGKNGWHGLTFVYERTRIHQVVLDPDSQADQSFHQLSWSELEHPSDKESSLPSMSIMLQEDEMTNSFLDDKGLRHTLHEESDAYTEGMDRMERFLSIWEEEGCRMVPMSCQNHDSFAANSQFITHLTGRILGTQGLKQTPIDTKGFESVLKLVGTTTADSFDLFYGLYKYNRNSQETIRKLKESMDDVISELHRMEKEKEERI